MLKSKEHNNMDKFDKAFPAAALLGVAVGLSIFQWGIMIGTGLGLVTFGVGGLVAGVIAAGISWFILGLLASFGLDIYGYFLPSSIKHRTDYAIVPLAAVVGFGAAIRPFLIFTLLGGNMPITIIICVIVALYAYVLSRFVFTLIAMASNLR
jgi:hypothetical protein